MLIPAPSARVHTLLVAALLLAACGSDGTAPDTTRIATAVGSLNQSATAGTPVSEIPSIRVNNSAGAPVAGVAVTFAVTSGDGSVGAASATTNASGVANAGSWTLGPAVGTNTLTATTAGATGAPITFTATGTAGAAAALLKTAGDSQSATAGAAAPVAPSVTVRDANSNAVPGVTVTFAAASGGGVVTGANATTNAAGVATVGSWQLGTAVGANTLTATVAGLTPVTFTATGTVGPASVVSKVAGDAQVALSRSTVASAPAVKVTDAFGNPVPGVQVTFAVTAGEGTLSAVQSSTGPDGIAAAGTWTLGRAGPNRVSATATGSGLTGNPALFTATAQEILVNPASDTTMSGTVILTRFVVSAGRTVTVSGPLTIQADSTIVIDGTLIGNCVPITIRGEQLLTITGKVSNGCGPAAGGESLTLVGEGGYILNGAEIITGGALRISNDNALLASMTGGGMQASALALGRSAGGSCDLQGVTIRPQPERVGDGADGQTGGPGSSAHEWTLRCNGDLRIMGNVKIHGQSGGTGGKGEHASLTFASAAGGPGGYGGIMRIRATGKVLFSGSGNRIETGLGGAGGSARAMAAINEAGAQAPSAEAYGGSGGMPGRLDLKGDGGLEVAAPFEIFLGLSGNGGQAYARGSDGRNATAVQPAQAGGNATALGGAGEHTPQETLTPLTNVTGAQLVIMLGGAGGRGGAAEAIAGNGGAGGEVFIHGAAGGSSRAGGGEGGSSFVKDWQNTITGLGGDGGDTSIMGGNGGDGWNDCVPEQLQAGGNGGNGGAVTASNGRGGIGSTAGVPGGLTIALAANGGRGGNGSGPGVGGSAGADDLLTTGILPDVHASFEDGEPGAGCVVEPTGTVQGVLYFMLDGVQAAGQPAAGVPVRLGERETVTNALGEYLFANVVLGTYVLQALGHPAFLSCPSQDVLVAAVVLTVLYTCSPIAFTMAITPSYRHFTTESEVCLAIATSLLLAGAPFRAQANGPIGGLPDNPVYTGTLDSSGAATLRARILSYGIYTWAVTILGQQKFTSINVTSSSGSCSN